jgi:hypothetical protein
MRIQISTNNYGSGSRPVSSKTYETYGSGSGILATTHATIAIIPYHPQQLGQRTYFYYGYGILRTRY